MDKEQNPRFLTAISLYIIIAATTTAAAENIIYVKQGATGNGTTWTNAYGNLQNALDTAISNDEIWVAAGT
ncbi:MAG: hypothetical protein KAR47_13495, partial [Planctomycetes bacterium]|nr:hypothetical protein [Planctomycetota bacterium]